MAVKSIVRLLCFVALTLAISSLAACRTTEDMLRQIPPEMLEKALGPDGVRKLNAAWAGGADTIRWIVGAAVISGILLFALFTDRPRKRKPKPPKKPRRLRKRSR